jgi:hypothetical protein
MFYFMESATIIIFFTRLALSEGESCEKEYSLYTHLTLVIMMKKMDGIIYDVVTRAPSEPFQ